MTLTSTHILKQVKVDPSTSFPCMLHQCLTDIEALGERDPSMTKLSGIIGWQRQGTAFRVHDKKKFEELIMPVWFIRLKYSSFIRQLTLFGFKKIHKDNAHVGVQKGAMYHPLFLRGHSKLAEGIHKLKKNKQVCQTLSPEQCMPSGPHSLQGQDLQDNGYYHNDGGVPHKTMAADYPSSFLTQRTMNYVGTMAHQCQQQYVPSPQGCHSSNALYGNANGTANGLVHMLSPSMVYASPISQQSNHIAATMMHHAYGDEQQQQQQQVPDMEPSNMFLPQQQQEHQQPFTTSRLRSFLETVDLGLAVPGLGEGTLASDDEVSNNNEFLLEPTPFPPSTSAPADVASSSETSFHHNGRFIVNSNMDNEPLPFFTPVETDLRV